jgi:hypothetical protein
MLNLASDLRSRVEATLEHRIPRALTPPQRPTPDRMPTGIASVDAITGGIPLGCLTEICGPASSGRTSVLMALIAECMRRDEICALVDASDAFDPQSAAGARVDLGKLLWVRCFSGCHSERIEESLLNQNCMGIVGIPRYARNDKTGVGIPPAKTRWFGMTKKANHSDPLEQALKATDLLLQAGGFGLVILDIADIPLSAARRIPLTTWFRFRRTVENTSTALVVIEEQPHAKSCASLVMEFSPGQASWSETAEANGTLVSVHSGTLSSALGEVNFCVTSQGIAIPFDQPASSFNMPQRWNTPRLLDSVHVHLQVTRSRTNHAAKFPAQPERAFLFAQETGENTKGTKDTKVVSLVN